MLKAFIISHHLVMKILATMPLSPSVLVPSKSGRKVSSIASSELHPSATSLAAASVSRVDIPVYCSILAAVVVGLVAYIAFKR